MDMLRDLCSKTGYSLVDTNLGIVKVVASAECPAAPYIEGDLADVIQRLIRLARKTYH